MMHRPEDVKDRISNIQQIEDIIVAMRGLAAAHSMDARKHLIAIKTYEATVAEAIAHALACAPGLTPVADEKQEPRVQIRIVIGAEQGFSGTYNDRIVETGLKPHSTASEYLYMLVGQRCVSEFSMRGQHPIWSSGMVSRISDVPGLASDMSDMLFTRLADHRVDSVVLLSAKPDEHGYSIDERSLMPFDFSRFARSANNRLPLLTLPPQTLIETLIEEYVFCEMCEALVLAFAAENEARMKAMTRARANVQRINTDLQREYNQARQEQTTTEIIELSSSSP